MAGTTVIGIIAIGGTIATGIAIGTIVTGITAKSRCQSSLGSRGASTINPARKRSLAGLFYVRPIEGRC